MTGLPEPVVSLKVERESQIIYRSTDNRQEKIFHALNWRAARCSPISDPAEQRVRYSDFSIVTFPGGSVKRKIGCFPLGLEATDLRKSRTRHIDIHKLNRLNR